jgi:hypothetical protein
MLLPYIVPYVSIRQICWIAVASVASKWLANITLQITLYFSVVTFTVLHCGHCSIPLGADALSYRLSCFVTRGPGPGPRPGIFEVRSTQSVSSPLLSSAFPPPNSSSCHNPAQERRDPIPPPCNLLFTSAAGFTPPLPVATQHKGGEIQPHPHATFSSLLLQIFLSPFRICLWIKMGVCVSNRSAAAVCLRLQDLLLLRACVSKVCCPAARLHLQRLLRWFVSHSFASSIFTFLYVFQVCCQFSAPIFFQ